MNPGTMERVPRMTEYLIDDWAQSIFGMQPGAKRNGAMRGPGRWRYDVRKPQTLSRY